jgi:thioester reductase-like protein
MMGWTMQEAWLLVELGRRALVATLDGGPPLRAGEDPRFRAEVRASSGDVVLDLHLDAAEATLALDPPDHEEHRFRDAWALVVEGAAAPATLRPGAPPAAVRAPRGALVLRPATETRVIMRRLDGEPEEVPLADAAFHVHTRQSSRRALPPRTEPLPPFMTPTEPEARPFWELDLGAPRFVAALRFDLTGVPAGARVVATAYAYAAPSGDPPPGSFTCEAGAPDERGRLTLAASPETIAARVRVTLIAPRGEAASLSLRAAEVLAADPYAATWRATLRRSFALFRDRTLFTDVEGRARDRTYGEVWAHAMALARGLAVRLEQRDEERVVLGLLLHNRAEWVLADLAAVERGYVVVPLGPDEPDARLAEVIAAARPTCIVCEAGDAERISALAPKLRLLVVCDAAGKVSGPRRVRFEDVVNHGAGARTPPPAKRREDDLFTVIFTSGSTGRPKGAMRSYAGFQAMLRSYGLDQGARHLSHQPLWHVSERMFLPSLLVQGATIAFSRGGAHLLDELRAFEPTVFGSVPRVFEVLHASFRRALRAAVAAAPERPLADVEAEELGAVRSAFGGRVRALSVGSAPVSAEVLGFLRRAFADLWVTEGYGTTELGTIAVNGVVRAHVEVKIVPLPDAPADLHRGELWVRTPHAITGYLGDARPLADAEGFVATGDLAERDASGAVRVVGRLGSAVKLAQGEFVSAERVETALEAAPIVDRLFIHAPSGAPGVAALVVPDREALARLLGADGALAELAARPDAAPAVLAALRAHARREGLPAWEWPRGVHLEAAPFTAEGGLLTSTGKLARGVLAARYGARLAALAAGDPPADPETSPDDGDLAARIARVAGRVLGHPLDPHDKLAEAGVDSLSAAEILAALRRDLGRDVPLSLWFEAPTAADLAARLERFAAPAALSPEIAADLALAPRSAPPYAPRPLRAVLLTGATGLLGAHLVEALVARTELRLLCLVRAPDDDAAERRLEAALAAYAIAAPPPGRVRAVAADLAAPRLGLAAERWAELAAESDAIVHAAAEVSWLAPYPALRAANVLGTSALLDLAAEGRARPFHFVSTISTAPADGDEDTTLPLAAARAGTPYGLSKWIAEAHVRRAGLPFAVYRPGMIAGSTRTGHGNPDDFLHRYLSGAAEMGLSLDLEERLDMTPVDFVAQAITALLVAEPAGGGATHHLVNVDRSPTYRELGRALRAAGVDVAPVSYAAFREALARSGTSRLGALSAFFPAEGFSLRTGPWPHARTAARLAALGVEAPVVDEALMARYVDSLRARGFVR